MEHGLLVRERPPSGQPEVTVRPIHRQRQGNPALSADTSGDGLKIGEKPSERKLVRRLPSIAVAWRHRFE